jgi:hypothetical protein
MGSENDLSTEELETEDGRHRAAQRELADAREKFKAELEGADRALAVGLINAAVVISDALHEAVQANGGRPVDEGDANPVIEREFGVAAMTIYAALDNVHNRADIEALAALLGAIGADLQTMFEATGGSVEFSLPPDDDELSGEDGAEEVR